MTGSSGEAGAKQEPPVTTVAANIDFCAVVGGGAMEGYMVALLLAPAPWTRQWSWLLVMGWRRISK